MQLVQELTDSTIELFTLVLPKGTLLYKGFETETKFDYSFKGPSWFALDRKEAEKYGRHVCSVKLSHKLLLINISSGIFKMHFADMLNMIPDKEEREEALGALGIPDPETQQSLINKRILKMHQPENKCKRNVDLEMETKYFQGHSRYSGKALDKTMVQNMMNIYGKIVDGYVQPMDVPSCWHGRFPKEVCLFNVSKSQLHPSSKAQRGGGCARKFLESRDFKPGELEAANVKKLRRLGYPEHEVERYVRTLEWPNYIIIK